MSATLQQIVQSARTVAVLGVSTKPARPAFYVPDYLADKGLRILPVNPVYAGEQLWGQTVRHALTEIDEPVDILDVFRRSEHIPGHLDEILAMRPLPRTVWLQLGIRNDDAAKVLNESGIQVIQDQCLLVEHRRWARSE